MARRRSSTPPPPVEEQIVEIDVSNEMRESFLEYAYSVIYSRAIPDARDGLKPVQRRILFQMREMGLRPDRGHVKCARIVGDVMGRLHPHGDQAIYDTLVRLAQPWVMSVPMVDGHGNFGNQDDGPAAYRYTEARLAQPAMLMTAWIDEDVVDMIPNYDGRETQPDVLPAAIPNLLVNGASGIAVGMATNMPPHNLGEVVAAARHLIDKPEADLEELMRYVPGPDFPTGGTIVGLDGIREAYATGRGSFKTRATTRIENITPRRKGIVITALPYNVGPERVRERIAELVRAKKLTGIADIEDYTDREHGLRLVVEIKSGFNPEAVRDQLFRHTPLEESFSFNNVALVEGQPRTLGLKEMLEVYLEHRYEVIRRRSEYRRARRAERLHLVAGLMIALLDIDEVIEVIRSSDDAAAARQRLQDVFDLSEVQAQYILDTPLRRLTKFDRLSLEKEQDELTAEIAELDAILADPARLRQVVSDELAEVAAALPTPRRTVLLEGGAVSTARQAAQPVEEPDTPCWVLLSSTGRVARTATPEISGFDGRRAPHDAVVSRVAGTTRGVVGILTSAGRVVALDVVDLPALPSTAAAPTLAGASAVSDYVDLEPGERALALVSVAAGSPAIAVGTRMGIVKRVSPQRQPSKETWSVIRLNDGDEVVGVAAAPTPAAEQNGDEPTDPELVFITTDARLLRFPAETVRVQGRTGGGVAGVKLGKDAQVAFFGALSDGEDAVVITVAGSASSLPGTEPGSLKVSAFADFPAKGRATQGVRCHRFRSGEDVLVLGWAGRAPMAAAPDGAPVDLPDERAKRDITGNPAPGIIAAVAEPPGPAHARPAAEIDDPARS